MENLTNSLMRPLNSVQGGGNFQDISSLDNLRQAAQKDEVAALETVAKKFEGIFMQMLLKSMREANAGFESEDSPFSSGSGRMYRDMHEQQMALDLSEQGSLGLADLIVQQLGPQTSNFTPASVLRTQGLPLGAQATTSVSATSSPLPPQPTFNSPKDFVEKLMPYAKKAAQVLGGSPAMLIAQAALETGWGQKVVTNGAGDSSLNLFNIKADKRWQGESVNVKTLEYRDGLATREQAKFRRYDTIEDSFNDYVKFIKDSPRYQDALGKIDNAASFLHSLQQAGYATDPNYAQKIIGVLEQVTKLAR